MKDNIVPMGFRVTESLRKRIQHAAVERGIKLQELFREAMIYYLDAGAGATGKTKGILADLSPVEQRWVTSLVAYLRDDSKPYKQEMLRVMSSVMGTDIPMPRVTKRAG